MGLSYNDYLENKKKRQTPETEGLDLSYQEYQSSRAKANVQTPSQVAAQQQKPSILEKAKTTVSKVATGVVEFFRPKPVIPPVEIPTIAEDQKKRLEESYLKFPSFFPNPDFAPSQEAVPSAKLSVEGYKFAENPIDNSILATRDFLTYHPKALEFTAGVQRFVEEGLPNDKFSTNIGFGVLPSLSLFGITKDDPIHRSILNIIGETSKTVFGSSDLIKETFDQRLYKPPKNWLDKGIDTVSKAVGRMLPYVVGTTVTGGAGIPLKIGLPLVFATLGQLSDDSKTTIEQRLKQMPIDVTTGFVQAFIPGTKFVEGQFPQWAGKTFLRANLTGLNFGASTFLNQLIKGMSKEEAAKVGASAYLTGMLFYTAASSLNLLTDELLGTKVKTGQKLGTFSPDVVEEMVYKTGLDKTPNGQGLLDAVKEARETGVNIKLDLDSFRQGILYNKLKIATIPVGERKVAGGFKINWELTEASPTLPGEVKPEGKAVVPKVIIETVKAREGVVIPPPVVENLRKYILTPKVALTEETVATLKEKKIGVEELNFDRDGKITLYREGDIKVGQPNSFSIEQKEGQKPYVLNKDEILVNTTSEELANTYKQIYSPKEQGIYLDALKKWNELEAEVIAIPKETPAVAPVEKPIPTGGGGIPKELEPLTQEARNVGEFKTALSKTLDETGTDLIRGGQFQYTITDSPTINPNISPQNPLHTFGQPLGSKTGNLFAIDTTKLPEGYVIPSKSGQFNQITNPIPENAIIPLGKVTAGQPKNLEQRFYDFYTQATQGLGGGGGKLNLSLTPLKQVDQAKTFVISKNDEWYGHHVGDELTANQLVDKLNKERSGIFQYKKMAGVGGGGGVGVEKPMEQPSKPIIAKPSEITKIEKELAGEVEKRIGEINLPIGMTTKRVFKPPIQDKVEGLEFTDKEVESRYKASKGINTRGFYQKKIREFIQNFYHRLTRTYPELPNKPEFAEVRNILNKTRNVKSIVQDKTARILQGVTADIGPNKLDLFTRKVILDDLVQEAKAKRALPLGYSDYDEAGNLIIKNDLLNADKEKTDKLVFANPDVAEALTRRDKIWKAITDELVQYDILKEEQVKKDYFRHQILEYVNAKTRMTKGVGSALKQRRPGYAKQRQGSTYDINTDYLQAEFEVMSQALHDIEIAKLLKEVEKLPLNIKTDLVAKAKEQGAEDWHELIPEGYVTWQPKDGRVFYQVNTVPQKIINQFVDDIGKGILQIDQSLINKAMAMGGKRKELVLPEGVAKTLDNLWVAKQPNWVRDSTRSLTTLWKKWVLFNPRRVIKYNYQNFLGDADAVMAGNPAVFKKLPRATRELYRVFAEDAPMSPELKDFFERGGFSSMLTIQEIPDIKNIRIFERFYKNTEGGKTILQKLNIFSGYWNKVVKFTQFRESMLRYAAYLDNIDRFESGEKLNFGASNRDEVMALTNPKDQAAKVAIELLGDYANITALGKDLRESIIPFYSWNEVNITRYPKILRNAWQEGIGKGAGTKARVIGLGTIKGAWAIWGALLRMVALTGVVMLYNQLFHKEAEQDLSEYDRGRMHINLGYNKNGEVVILRGQGAFSDLLEWFGLDEAPILWGEYLDGKASLADIFGRVPLITGQIGLKPAVQKLLGSISPTFKIPTEFVSGFTWPYQGTQPYPITDKWRQIFQNVQLENEYDWIFQKPSRGYVKSWEKAVITVTDPAENAYRYIQEEKYKFLAIKGKGGSGSYYTPRSIVYRNYKKALAYGDKVAEQRAWDEMKKLGVKPGDLKQSLEATDPLSGLSKTEEREFLNDYLSQADKVRLQKANAYYKKVYLGR